MSMTIDHSDPMTTATFAPNGAPAIYLDYRATTPTDPRVLETMLPFFNR